MEKRILQPEARINRSSRQQPRVSAYGSAQFISCNKKNASAIRWVCLQGGALAIGDKPGERIHAHTLKNRGAGAVVTLLQGSEGALGIGDQVKAAGMDWIWFPFSASRPHKGDDSIHVIDLFMQMEAMLASGEKIYMHCSGGIHRSGMMAYGLLRYLGMQVKESLKTLRQLSVVTAGQACVERLAWAEQLVSSE